MKSPDRPRGPSSAVVSASSEVVAHSSQRPQERAANALALFRTAANSCPQQQATPLSPMASDRRPGSVSAPSTIGSVFGESTIGSANAHTASPATAQQFNDSLHTVLGAAQQYTDALNALSSASQAFGHALEQCSHHKPASEAVEGLAGGGGLHLLISNHLGILTSSLETQFIEPLTKSLDDSAKLQNKRESEFKSNLKAAKAALAKAEARNRAASRKKNRDLAEYRSMLLDMTTQIDDIHRLKFEFLCDLYHQGSIQAAQLKDCLGNISSVELEIFESIARKGWSGSGLDNLLTGDPFASSQTGHFTLLENRSLMHSVGDEDVTIREGSIEADDTLEDLGASVLANMGDHSDLEKHESDNESGNSAVLNSEI